MDRCCFKAMRPETNHGTRGQGGGKTAPRCPPSAPGRAVVFCLGWPKRSASSIPCDAWPIFTVLLLLMLLLLQVLQLLLLLLLLLLWFLARKTGANGLRE
jgi:hypothetical protein